MPRLDQPTARESANTAQPTEEIPRNWGAGEMGGGSIHGAGGRLGRGGGYALLPRRASGDARLRPNPKAEANLALSALARGGVPVTSPRRVDRASQPRACTVRGAEGLAQGGYPSRGGVCIPGASRASPLGRGVCCIGSERGTRIPDPPVARNPEAGSWISHRVPPLVPGPRPGPSPAPPPLPARRLTQRVRRGRCAGRCAPIAHPLRTHCAPTATRCAPIASRPGVLSGVGGRSRPYITPGVGAP